MIYLIISISTIYIIFICILTVYFYIQKKINYHNKDKKIFVSVIVPFRNESPTLPKIINDIILQTYPKDKFEVIFVNDNSTDNSPQIIKKHINNTNIFLLDPKNTKGKKKTLELGISHSCGQLIITTDADCRLQKNWIETIVNYYSSTKAKMIIAPVVYLTTKHLWSFANFQALEFLSLQAVTSATAKMNSPIMCNGANLCFEKAVYQQFNDAMNNKTASGDDTFLMFNIKHKYKKSIFYIDDIRAAVKTEPANNIKNFFNQRIRWAGKTKHYSDKFTLITGAIILTMNLTLFFSFWAILFNYSILYFFITFMVKTIFDFPMLWAITKHYKQQRLMWLYLPLQLVYFQYVTIVSILSFFIKPKWKNRRI